MDPSPGRLPKMPLLHPHIPVSDFDLDELLEFEPPVRWHPEPGERVLGELVKIETRRAFGSSAPVMFILVPPDADDIRDHRYITVRASGVVLKGALAQLKPQSGEQIVLRYEGLHPTADGLRKYALYRMAVKRPGGWEKAA